ncbi:DUF4123 domain-containing protein [Litoreibacter ponti]|nr:DUF4123 domain-containing protein [Litoreibacter ponti]
MFSAGRGQLYLLLDGARLPGCREILEASGAAHECLFQGNAFDELADEAPWIAELEPESRLAKQLFTKGSAPWHMWDQGPHVVFRAENGLDGIRRHLRRFNRVKDTNGKWFYMRYWEPSIVERYFSQLHDDVTRRKAWFAAEGVTEIYLTLPAEDAVLALRPSQPMTRRIGALQPELTAKERTMFAQTREAAFYAALGAGMAARNIDVIPLGRASAPTQDNWTDLAKAVAAHAKGINVRTQHGLAKLTVLCGSLGLAFWLDPRFDHDLRVIINAKHASEAERLNAAKELYDKTDVPVQAIETLKAMVGKLHCLDVPSILRQIAPKTLGHLSDQDLHSVAGLILSFDPKISSCPADVQRCAIGLGAALGVAWLANPFYTELKAAHLSPADPLQQVAEFLENLFEEMTR